MTRSFRYVATADGRFVAIETRSYESPLECFNAEFKDTAPAYPKHITAFRSAESKWRKRERKAAQ